MSKVKVKTIKHVLIHLHEVYEYIERYLKGEGVIESNLDILETAKNVLINLDSKIALENEDSMEMIHIEIREYVKSKLDTIDSIVAIELLVEEKKREYQQLLARSAREYKWIKDNSEDVAIREGYKQRTKKEIDEQKIYLNHLLELHKQKIRAFTKELNKHQNKNRELLINISNI